LENNQTSPNHAAKHLLRMGQLNKVGISILQEIYRLLTSLAKFAWLIETSNDSRKLRDDRKAASLRHWRKDARLAWEDYLPR
jgi:hypothetical protein